MEETKVDSGAESKTESQTDSTTNNASKNSNSGKRGNKRGGRRGDDGKKTSGGKRFDKMAARNPSLLQGVASYPFSYVAGQPVRIGQFDWKTSDAVPNIAKNVKNLITPGICTVNIRPSLPRTTSAVSAVNVAFTQEYTFLRHTISANLPYNVEDVGFYYIAVAEVYALINFLTRVFACSFVHSLSNRYLPQALLVSQGVNPTFMNNQAQARSALNLLIERAAALPVPAKIPYISARSSIFSGIYTEGTSNKDQLYMYVPDGFWMYEETGGTGKTPILRYYVTNYGATSSASTNYEGFKLFSFQDFVDQGMLMLDSLFSSQSTGIIGSNVRRAYGDANLVQLAAVPEFLSIEPEFNIAVLEQMANADIATRSLLDRSIASVSGSISRWYASTSWTITQQISDENDPIFWMNFSPKLHIPSQGLVNSANTAWHNKGEVDITVQKGADLACLAQFQKVLTTTTSETSSDLVVASSELMVSASNYIADGGDGDVDYPYARLICGTKLVTKAAMWTFLDADMKQFYANFIPNSAIYSFGGLSLAKIDLQYARVIMTMFSMNGSVQSIENENKLKEIDKYMKLHCLIDGLKHSFKFSPTQWITMINPPEEVPSSATQPDPWYTCDYYHIDKDLDNYTIIDQTGLTKIHEVRTIEAFAIPGVAAPY